MIDVRQGGRGDTLEISDTPWPIATALVWISRISLWLGVVLLVAGVVATRLD